MCGIFGVLCPGGLQLSDDSLNELVGKISYRGPDEISVDRLSEYCALGHCRLSIMDVAGGSQPMYSPDGSIAVTLNGEIYNFPSLRKQLEGEYTFRTRCDTEVLIPLYIKYGPTFVTHLSGMFAFVLYDKNNGYLMASRDHVGIVSAYYGVCSKDNSLWVASELKSLKQHCDKIYSLPPGHIIDSIDNVPRRYYQPQWILNYFNDTAIHDFGGYPMNQDECEDMYKTIRTLLESSVRGALGGINEVKAGFLLSGGLDSSLIASIATRAIKELPPSYVLSECKAYSVGLENSPDVIAAKKVADFLGLKHVVKTFTPEEGIEAVKRVVYHLETFDVTTIRASVPMYLLAERVHQDGTKFVLSGEGADEMFGGYLYFHEAPNSKLFQRELAERILNLNTSDCLRANKSCLAHSVEPRVPFLDIDLLNYVLDSVPPEQKMVNKAPYCYRMEKYILRKAFDTPETPYLPDEVLWRQKEQFSDGVGYSWIDALKAYSESQVTDAQMKTAGSRFHRYTPATKEAYWYRTIFEKLFPEPQCIDSVVLWSPKVDWGCPPDPSGRAQRAHTCTTNLSPLKLNGGCDHEKKEMAI